MNQLNILSARLTASKVAVLLALLAGLLLSFTAHPGNTQASTSNFKPGLGKGSADECTSTLAPGGNVQTFANSLSTGEEEYLRGVFTPHQTTSASRATAAPSRPTRRTGRGARRIQHESGKRL